MQFNCLGCGHMINLGSDYDNYKGLVRCHVCRTMINIESESGKIRSAHPADKSL